MARKRKKRRQSAASKARRKKKREEHAAFLQEHNITHFARTHQDCDHTGATKCNDYGSKLGTPPASMGLDGEAAVHHILPVSAVVGFMKEYATDEQKKNRVAAAYANMNWCINKDTNLVWLPYFPAYRRHIAANTVASAPDKEAAHNFDHPAYTKNVYNLLKPHWESIANQSQAKAKECKKHEEMVKTLDDEIPLRRSKLIDRTPKDVLTKASDLKAKKAPKADIEKELAGWWKTFSMRPAGAAPRPTELLFPRPLTKKMEAAIKRLHGSP
jgi:hypothetical protein